MLKRESAHRYESIDTSHDSIRPNVRPNIRLGENQLAKYSVFGEYQKSAIRGITNYKELSKEELFVEGLSGMLKSSSSGHVMCLSVLDLT